MVLPEVTSPNLSLSLGHLYDDLLRVNLIFTLSETRQR